MVLRKTYLTELLKNFFLQPSHPVNLAIFRIVLFSVIYYVVDFESLYWLGNVPASLMTPPLGMEWFHDVFQINQSWIEISYYIFVISCTFSIIGLFTRYSIFITTVLIFFLMGIPNFFGKVNHSHHLILFSTIMIVSRCSDVWSVDAYISYLKTKKTTIPRPSIVYGLPIRMIWIVVGLLYFFPGLWKIYDGGLDWIFTNNLKYYLYQLWFLKDWTPYIRLDEYPLVLTISAALTILFELSFIFLLFIKRLRYVAVFGGLLFHNMTGLFMGITFWTLQCCYVIFFDWSFLYRYYSKIVYSQRDRLSEFIVPNPKQNMTTVCLVGSLLILGNIYAGFNNYVNSWYFSCYPTFQRIATKPQVGMLSIEVKNGKDHFEKVDIETLESIREKFHYARFYKVLRMVVNEKDEDKFIALWNLVKAEDPHLYNVTSVRIYEDTVTTLPNLTDKNPLKRRLLAEFDTQ